MPDNQVQRKKLCQASLQNFWKSIRKKTHQQPKTELAKNTDNSNTGIQIAEISLTNEIV